MAQRLTLAVAASVFGGLTLAGCYHASESSTAPDPAGVAGTPSIAPIPTATPTPTPTPTPVPTPTPIPRGKGCGLPSGGGSGNGCPYVGSAFEGDVTEAIRQVQREHPSLFNFNDGFGGLAWRVHDRRRFYELMVAKLDTMGYCSDHDLEELGVKNSNRFNEQFQIVRSGEYVRWGPGSYRSTCYPAWF